MNEFIIVFRETLEASLIVGIIYTILIKNELYESIKKLWIGVAAALVFRRDQRQFTHKTLRKKL
jgi:high-affinity Fe2+/Pb2+ permease